MITERDRQIAHKLLDKLLDEYDPERARDTIYFEDMYVDNDYFWRYGEFPRTHYRITFNKEDENGKRN